MIIFLLTLILACQILLVVACGLMWKKVNLYLIWNTRNDSLEYEKAVTGVKLKAPKAKASRTDVRGRSIVPVDDLVDLADLDFDTVVKAVEDINRG